MKLFASFSFTAALFALAPFASAQTPAPYLETAPLSIQWQFNTTGVSGTTLGPKPRPVDSAGNITGIEDPDTLRPFDRITTERGTVITFSENGDQAFFVKHLLRAVIENGSQGLTEQELGGRWELTAVREPQTTVFGAATTPYAVYLTRIEPTAAGGRISWTYDTHDLPVTTAEPGFGDDPETEDVVEETAPAFKPIVIRTGLFLTFDQFVGNYTETLTNSRVTKASGSITVAFSLGFVSVFGESPAYSADAEAKLGEDYHSKVDIWSAFANGYMTANVRTTSSALPAVTLSNVKLAGHGSWEKVIKDFTPYLDKGYYLESGYSGLAPLNIKIGASKFQRRELFPNFGTNVP